MLRELGIAQVRLLAAARGFLRTQSVRGVDVAVHPECYLAGWSNVPGNARLLALARQPGAGILVAQRRVKDALNVMRHAHWATAGDGPIAGDIDQLVVTWCRAGDFAEDGEYRDRYFRTSARATPRTLWFALATDEGEGHKMDANVRVLRRRPGARRFSPAFLARSAACAVVRRRARHLPRLSAVVTYAQQVVAEVRRLFVAGKFREVLTPYEAQPWQHAVYRAVKEFDPTVRTVGYLHSALPPVPADLAFREGAPDVLYVHGQGQIDILVRHLGWPAERLRAIPALRYRREDDASLAGFIFLPMDFSAPETILGELEAYLVTAAPGSLSPLTVRNHPVMRESAKHLQLVSALDRILEANADRFTREGGEPTSVFIGATAAIIEALERGVSVIHISSRPLVEVHTQDLWSQFEVEPFGEHLFRYRMRERGAYISFGEEADMFEKYLRQGGVR